MKIRFWGVRGSLPRPLTSEQVRTKIAAVLQMARPEDLDSQLSRERFLGRLPASLFGTVGGNTTCVEVRTSGNDVILFDAGSGMQQFSSMLMKEQEHIDTFHIFFSHFHWDHLQGLPFFPSSMIGVLFSIFTALGRTFARLLKDRCAIPIFP